MASRGACYKTAMQDRFIASKTASRLPRGVWVLGLVSLLMDISSEMIHGLLPLYLSVGLGLSMLSIGWIEGVAEATASITKLFSGALSDYLGKRKLLTAIGYGMAAFTKPVFPLAGGLANPLAWIITARFVDRIGKGVRGAPRDALIAAMTPASMWGAAFGLRQSLDTVGAFAGPLLAIGLMILSANNFALVFWVAVIPAFGAFALVLSGVKEVKPEPGPAALRPALNWREIKLFRAPFWLITLIAAVLTLARFSEAFLILRALDLGVALALAPLVLVAMNVAYSLAAYPAGKLSDRYGRKAPLLAGILLLVFGQAMLAWAGSLAALVLGVLLWGLHMGLTQGLLAAMVADTAPQHLRGTGFGVFHLVSGVMMLAASVLAGALWQAFGAAATFHAGAGFAALAFAGLLLVRHPSPGHS